MIRVTVNGYLSVDVQLKKEISSGLVLAELASWLWLLRSHSISLPSFPRFTQSRFVLPGHGLAGGQATKNPKSQSLILALAGEQPRALLARRQIIDLIIRLVES